MNLDDKQINSNLFRCFLETNTFKPDDVILEYFSRQITYSEFTGLVERFKNALTGLGIKGNDRVIVALITAPDSIALLYACSDLGIIPVMTDICLDLKDLDSLIVSAEAKAVFMHDLSSPHMYKAAKMHGDIPFFILSPCSFLSYKAKPFCEIRFLLQGNTYRKADWLCSNVEYWDKAVSRLSDKTSVSTSGSDGDGEVIFATSGTTGANKYVSLTNYQLNMSALQNMNDRQDESVETVLNILPIFICYGFVISIHMPLLYSKKIVIYPLYEPKDLVSYIIQNRPNQISGVFFHFTALMEDPRLKYQDLSFLTDLRVGGDKCDLDQLTRINVFLSEHGCKTKLNQGYGMTEVAAGAFLQRDDENYVLGSVGKALPNVEVKIINEGGQEVTQGETGEICLHSPCQTKGYFNNNELTAELLKEHEDGKIWVHTGDLGYLDKDQNLFIVDRIKRMAVASDGTKLYLSNIENVVKAMPEVENAAVVAYKQQNEIRLVLFIESNGKISDLKLKKIVKIHLEENLPRYLQPDHCFVLNGIPHTGSGKTDYHELEKLSKSYT